MTGERLALLAGLLLVPVALLWFGHGLRNRSRAAKLAFWGATLGHIAALLVTTAAALNPPVWWAGGGFWRDFAVHWSLLVGVALGACAGAAIGWRDGSRQAADGALDP